MTTCIISLGLAVEAMKELRPQAADTHQEGKSGEQS